MLENLSLSPRRGSNPPVGGSAGGIWSLWLHLRSTRVLPGEDGPLPSFAELGRQLKLTRDRVRQLFERLRPLIETCLRRAGRRPER